MFKNLFGNKKKEEERKQKEDKNKRHARKYDREELDDVLELQQEMEDKRQQRVKAINESFPFMGDNNNDEKKPKKDKDHDKDKGGFEIGGM
jgi:hypothetical protein